MIKKTEIKLKYSCIILFLAYCLVFASCNKVNEERAQKEASTKIEETQKIDDNDLNETADDLHRVDYKQFYDDLSGHGEWVQVKASDIGIDINKLKTQAENDPVHREKILDILAGVNTANAETDVDVDFGMFFVWRPSPDLAVSLDASTEQPAEYIPYSNGQWVNSDDGWYFQAATPYEDITSHYGRWAYSPGMGWVWVPGRVWAPAWVDWREDDDYIAWSPLPPGAYIEDNIIINPFPVVEEHYVVIEKQYFCEPECYHHIYWDREHWDRCRVMNRTEGIFVDRTTIFNRGPDITNIERITGKHFDKVKINRVDNISKVKFSGNEINTYSPHFVKDASDVKRKQPVSQPNTFKEFANVKQKDNYAGMNEKQQKDLTNKNNKTGITQKEGLNGNNKNGNLKSNDSRTQKFSNKHYREDQGNKIKKNEGNYKQKNYSDNKGNKNKQPGTNKNNTGKDNNGNYKQPEKNKDRGNNSQPKQHGNNKQPGTDKQPGNNRQKGNDNKSGNNSNGNNKGHKK